MKRAGGLRPAEGIRKRLLDPFIRWRNAFRTGSKVIYLHVGAHKTGTSLIQSMLKREATRLRWHGFYYDRVFYHVGKRLARGSPLPAGERHELRRQLDARLRSRPEPNVIGSSENLFGDLFRSYANIRTVAEDLRWLLDGYDVRIIACIRRQDEFVQSVYQQYVKQGGTLPFVRFLEVHDVRAYRWPDLLREYAEVFGRSNLAVCCYDEVRAHPERALETVFEPLVSVRRRVRSRPAVVNPGLSPKGLQMALRCNDLLRGDEQRLFRRFLQTSFARQPGEAFSMFTTEQRQELMAAYRPSNEACVEEFLGGSPRWRRYLCGDADELEAKGVSQ